MTYNPLDDLAFREKVVHAYNGAKLTNQQAIVDLFGNIDGLTKSKVGYWARKAEKARRKLFTKNPPDLILDFDFIKRLAALVSDPERFYSFKHIKEYLEIEDKRAYTTSDISLATRALLFSHLCIPLCFIYFISLAEDILKIGIATNYITRWSKLETGSYSKLVAHLVLMFPLKYKWEVDQWFRDEYIKHRVYRKSDSHKPYRKNRGEFYTWFVLEQFKDSDNKVISIKTKEGNVSVNVTLKKLQPDSQEFKKISSQLRLWGCLKNKRSKQESKTRLAQDILDHPLLSDYPKNMRDHQMIEGFEEEDLTQNSSSPVDSEQALLKKIAKCKEELKGLQAKLERSQKSKPPL